MSEQSSNVVSLKTTSSSVLQFEIETLFNNLLTQHILPDLPSIADALTDHISKKLESATSNNDLMYLMEVEKKLKNNKSIIIDSYTGFLLDNISSWINPDSTYQESIIDNESENSLCLVENSILEYKLAWQAAARQMDMSEQLQNLYNCESRLEDITSAEPERIPIGSIVICEHFASALSPLALNLETIQDLLFNFARLLKNSVAKMWVEADKCLTDMGFKLKTPKVSTYSDAPEHNADHGAQRTTAKTATNHSATSQTTTEETDPEFVDNIAQQVVSRVEALLNQQLNNNNRAGSEGHDATVSVSFAAHDLAIALTSIQNELTDQHSTILNLTESIKTAMISQGIKQTLSPRQEDLIDMVGLLFEYIIDDHELPEDIKNLIGLLQIPVLKLALIDREFLSNREHPGRQLLNGMTSAGMHCDDREDPVLHLIEKTVKTIIRGFTDNPNIFSECLIHFNNNLLQIENNEIQVIDENDWIINNQDETDISELENQSPVSIVSDEDIATESPVEQIINAYNTRYKIPDTLKDLIFIGWEEVLQFSMEKNHSDEFWFHRVNILDMLLWNLQDNHKESIPFDDWLTLKNQVFNQLNEVEFNPFIIAEWLHAINHLSNHEIQLEEEIVIQKEPDQQTDSNDYADHEKWEPEYSEPSSIPLDEDRCLSDTSTEIKPDVGQWVEFIGKNEHSLRCKLAIINPHTDRYVFVNKSGMKVADWSGTELEKAIKNQRVEILDTHQFFDRALHAVMGNFLKF